MLKPDCLITSNGIRTVAYEDPALLHQSFTICVDTNNATERDLNHPHFLEHVLLGDTSQWGGQSYCQVAAETANEANASTYPEAIAFTLDCVPGAVKKLFPALLQTLAAPKLSEESVERERTIIASEMRERAADPESGIYERAWHNHGFAHTALQEAAGLSSVNSDTLRAFHKRTFTAANIFVVTAGPTKIGDIAHYIEDSSLQPSGKSSQGVVTRDFTTAHQPVVSGSETEQTNRYLQVFNSTQAPEIARVFDELNGSDLEGSFNDQAINKVGVYSARLSTIPYPYAANARYYLETEGDLPKVKKVHKLAANVLTHAAEQSPTPQLLAHAKLSVRNGEIFKGEGDFGKGRPGLITSNMIEQLPQFPHIASIDERLDRVDQVSPDDVRAIAQSLVEAPRSFSLVGSADSIKRMTGHLLK